VEVVLDRLPSLEGVILDERGEGAIHGTVIDEDGRPPTREAEVRLFPSPEAAEASAAGFCDAEGRFALPAPPGAVFRIEAGDLPGPWCARDGVPAGARDVVLRLSRAGPVPVSGLVLGADGGAAGGVEVTAVRCGPAGTRPVEPLRRGAAADDGRTPRSRVTTAPDGTFRFPDLPPGRWVVYAGTPGGAIVPVEAALLSPSAAGPVRLGVRPGWTLRARIALDAEEVPSAVVRVSTRPPAGSPLPRFEVELEPGPGGVLEIPGLPPGTVEVTVVGRDGRPRRTAVEERPAGAPAVELR